MQQRSGTSWVNIELIYNVDILRAIVQKYLLEKSRICCQAKNERNYHVFYYLLAGANELEKTSLALHPPHYYHYLNQVSQITTLSAFYIWIYTVDFG